MKHRKKHQWMRGLYHWIIFFALAAFVTTCCMLLFLSVLSKSLAITFTEAHIAVAAKLTFVNVLFISLLFTVLDAVRRWYTVKRPVQKILAAAEKITQGDFDVRLKPVGTVFADDGFNQIIACFNQMAEELSGTETLRSDFIANVSHELKTPLSVMQNYGTMLQKPGLSEEERIEYAKGITKAARRLADLITNILKLNKLENQQIFPHAQVYDLTEQLCECMLSFESEWEKKSISIVTDLDDGVMICSDRELLYLVWSNLFSNALKFTESGGTVSVRLKQSENRITVSVADTGCGMTPEVGKHIFEKFYQGDPSRATHGNGLGLALVKRVVDIAGGEIHVESVFDRGSTFTVELRKNPREDIHA